MPRHVFNDLMLLYEAEAEVAKHRRG